MNKYKMINLLNDISNIVHGDNLEKGFEKQAIPIALMLVVTELSEAVEADRKNRSANLEEFEKWLCRITGTPLTDADYALNFEKYVKDSFEDEIADAFIRLFDFCGGHGVNIGKHIQYKLRYNRTREYKHGCKY